METDRNKKKYHHKSIFKYKEISPPVGNFSAICQSFRVVSFSSKKKFLLLAKTQFYQHIFHCIVGSKTEKLIATLPIRMEVVTASLSVDEDMLFLVLFSRPNCFSKKPFYITQCYIPNTEIFYPISAPSYLQCPTVKCLKTNSKFLFSGDNRRYEAYDVQCSETEFRINLDSRSKNGIIWWNLKQRTQLEYVRQDVKNGLCKFVSSSSKTFRLPNLPNPLPFEFLYLTSESNQNVILYLTQSILGVILPRSALELKLTYIPLLINANLSTFSILSHDLFLTLTPKRSILCILIDALSQPRASFEFKLADDCREQFMMLCSMSSMSCIDQRTGAQLSISLNYKNIIGNEPRFFIPLLHHSVLECGSKSDLLHYISMEILITFWGGQIFDEYFLCLFRTELQKLLQPKQIEFFGTIASTFCPNCHFKKELSSFTSYQSDYIDVQTMPPQLQNWGWLKNLYSDIFYEKNLNNGENSIYDLLIKLIMTFDISAIQKELQFVALMQLSILYLRILNHDIIFPYEFPRHFQDKVIDSLPKSSYENWEAHGLVYATGRVKTKSLTFDKNLDQEEMAKMWWRIRAVPKRLSTNNYDYDLFASIGDATEATQEIWAQQDLVSLYKPLFDVSSTSMFDF